MDIRSMQHTMRSRCRRLLEIFMFPKTTIPRLRSRSWESELLCRRIWQRILLESGSRISTVVTEVAFGLGFDTEKLISMFPFEEDLLAMSEEGQIQLFKEKTWKITL